MSRTTLFFVAACLMVGAVTVPAPADLVPGSAGRIGPVAEPKGLSFAGPGLGRIDVLAGIGPVAEAHGARVAGLPPLEIGPVMEPQG